MSLLLFLNPLAFTDISLGYDTISTVASLTISDITPLLTWSPIAVSTAIETAIAILHSRFPSAYDCNAKIIRLSTNVIVFVT